MTATVYAADSLAVLRTLDDESVHAIVTDPPYGLANHKPAAVVTALTAWANGDRESVPNGKGFMGRDWDAFVPPPAVWDECMRVLKPGGHMLVFAGTRTVDLMGLSVRMAGFEIRDSITWMYGCLTSDAEILTERGWRPGIEVEQGERVAQWDHETGSISLAPVAETFRAPWEGPMRVLRTSDTDQVLTPNHRVYHRPRQRQMADGVRHQWYEQEWQVAEAGELSTWNSTQLPIAGEHDGPGIGGTDYASLLGWVWSEGGFDPSGTGVRIYQSSVNAEKVAEIDALMDRTGPHKRYDRTRTWRGRDYVETMWFISGELAQRVRADLPGKRPTYDLLWRMTLAEKRALRDAALAGDGHQDGKGVWQFYQRHEDDLIWFSTLLALVGQAGKVGMRPDRDNGTVYVRDRSTTELQARHLRNSSEHYTGEVWCVRVPTGAFVARRNGHVFITGNSGFPKSQDVSKAIDKAAGADREVVGTAADFARDGATRRTDGSHDLPGSGGTMGKFGDRWSADITAPATDAAKQWQGWGTALKPASEPIIVARKPLTGTVAANVQAHGTGAINVDATRVATDWATDPTKRGWQGRNLSHDGGAVQFVDHDKHLSQPHEGGRWPSNVVLTHGPECAEQCQDGCPVAELDAQSGTLKTGGPVTKTGMTGSHGIYRGGQEQYASADRNPGDSGGASRFFPTFKYQAKAPSKERPKVLIDGHEKGHPTVKPLALMRWLVKLVTPPGGVVLDPFAGSGTTAEAARLEGFESILIEREPQWIAARLGVDESTFLTLDAEPTLYDLIAVALDDPSLRALYRANKEEWTPGHTAAVKARLAELEQAA